MRKGLPGPQEISCVRPLLAKPGVGDELYLYLAVLGSAVSLALVKEEAGKQHPVYYTSKALIVVKTRYSLIEKLTLALVTAVRKLQPYLQAHRLVVLIDQPLRQIFQRLEISGRIMKWAVELSEYDIRYTLQASVKGKAAADFIAELTLTQLEEVVDPSRWILYMDGSANDQDCEAGVLLTSLDGSCHEYALQFKFLTFNNEAEYEALLIGLRLA